MKKLLLTLLCAITVGAASAWGAETTVTYKAEEGQYLVGSNWVTPTNSNITDMTNIKFGDFYFTLYKQSSNTPGYYNSGKNLRSYNNDYFILKPVDGNDYVITKVVINHTTNYLKGYAKCEYIESGVTKTATATQQTTNGAVLTLNLGTPGASQIKFKSTGSNRVTSISITYDVLSSDVEKVTCADANAENVIEASHEQEITFTAKNAGFFTITDGKAFNEAVVAADKNSYKYKANFGSDKNDYTITVVPMNSNKETVAGTEATFTIKYKKAEQPGKPTLTPGGGAVAKGSVITFEATNATKYYYKVNGGDAVEAESNTYTVDQDEAFTLEVWSANNDWIDGGEHTVANYTISKEPQYALVTNASQIVAGGTYIIAATTQDNNLNDVLNAMGYDNGNKKYTSVTGLVANGNYVRVPDGVDVNVFTLEASEGGFKIKSLKNEKYATIATSGTDLTAGTTGSVFTFTLNSDNTVEIVSSVSTRHISFNGSVFGHYATSQTSGSYYTPCLYKLVTEEVAEVPAELWMHGHFYDRYYDLSQPVEMKKDGNVFTATGIQLGGNSAVTDGDYGCVFTTHVPAGAVAHAPGKRFANHASNWAEHTEGYVLDADGLKAASDVNSQDDLKPITHEKGEGVYDVKVDFNDAANPVVTLDYKSDVTGIEGITVEDNAAVEYFNLQGVRVANPSNGVFIRRQGNAVSKVVL